MSVVRCVWCRAPHVDLQANRPEPGSRDLLAEEPGRHRVLQAETGARWRRREETPAPAAGLRRAAVSGHTATPSIRSSRGSWRFRGFLVPKGASGEFLVVQVDSPPDPELPRCFFQLHPEAAAAEREEVWRALVPPDRLHFTLHGLFRPWIRAADMRRLWPWLKQSVHPPDQSGRLFRCGKALLLKGRC